VAEKKKKKFSLGIRRAPAGAAAGTESPKKHARLDTAFLIVIFAMLTYGAIMVFSASYPAALSKTGDSFHFISKHMLFVLAGTAVMFVASYVDYHIFRRFVFPLVIVAYILLILVLIPGIGSTLGTFARRWIVVGGENLGINFQPSEIMKFATIVLFAHLIALNQKRMNTFTYGVVPFMVCLMATAVLMMLEPHLSGTLLIFAVGSLMMIIGGTKLRWFMGLAGIGGLGVAGLAIIGKLSYITDRIDSWLDPFGDVLGDTYQTVQSLIAIGSGGIMGRGVGNSIQKYLYLPESYNDYIFAIICEELGLIGALLVIILFVVFAMRGFSIASKAPDTFGFMMGVGITLQVCIQALLNIAVVTNTIPPTGISLPFFSYGGTALLMLMGEVGILLNISRQASIEKV